MEHRHTEEKEEHSWYDKKYKILLFIPIVLLVLSLAYLFYFYNTTGDIMNKDVTLSGGTTITLRGDFNTEVLESSLQKEYSDISFRRLTDFASAKQIAFIVESSAEPDKLTASIEEVLGYESENKPKTLPNDVVEVVNYVKAMNYGLKRINDLPLSLRLIKEIHAELMQDVRGGEKTPGEFRNSQNWIGPRGCTLSNARFVPPPPHEMMRSLGELEKYMYSKTMHRY